MKTRAHVLISGYVQDVFFRQETKRRADSLDVKGWVLNRDDGRVEAVFEGEEHDVNALVEFCRRGPPRATVTNAAVEWAEYVGEFEGFEIRY
ncbi:MAG TPA: acylphosphatase [Candidatus Bathyarchaeia archaeon]|nr:acylphosphatase [Candidatus Bathyarchaeia archaeon]